ncbi:MAG: diguanylate cyclase, partial [Actinobacteria bacterium]|nr:diguanylate cyclase [Actinomycetota bacterium]
MGVTLRFSISDEFELFTVLVGLIIGAEILAMTYLLRRAGVTPLRDPGQLVLYGLIVAAVAAVAGLLVAVAGLTDPQMLGEEFLHVWRSWLIDDLFGLVCITPAVLMFGRRIHLSAAEVLEYVIAIAFTGITTYVVFFVIVPGQQGLLGWPYIVVLGSSWIAVRFGLRAVAPVLAVQFWLALVGTVGGAGAFAAASPDPLDRVALAVLRDGRLASIARDNESSLLLREVIDGSDALIFAKSYKGNDAEAGRYILVNRAWSETTGVSDEETLQHSDRDIFPSDVSAAFLAVDREVMAANDAFEVEERNLDASGEERSYLSSKFPLRDSDGAVWGVGGIATDITEVLASREREARQSELLHAVFELSPTPAVRLSMSDRVGVQVHAANAAMCALLGAPSGRIEDCNLLEHVHPEDAETALGVLTLAAAESGTSEGPSVRQREVRMRTDDGRMVWVLMSAAAVRGTSPADAEIVAQFEDFTARRAAEEALSDQAMRDAVTGLPNRRALHERMDSALQRLRRHPGMVTVMFCDLDHFKDINDSLGHAVGDRLLVEVAGRLRSALRPEDTIARLGGDEFVALGEGITDESAAMLMAMRLQDRLSIPWLHAEQAYRPTMSIGIAMTTDADVSVDELLRRADLAMYRAKEGGRNRIEVYERSVDDEVQRAVAIQHDLRRAIDTGALVVHYQPIVRLSDEEVVGAEALVRMRRPDGGLLPPLDFVPQAEVTGLVVPMGAWVLQQALADLAGLRQRGLEYV